MASPRDSRKRRLSPSDIIFSCSICQKPLSCNYTGVDENQGLRRDGKDSSNGKITKLWLTECAHLTCGQHLQGGGVPFYSDGRPPRATCPLCLAERKDCSEKALFYINGISDGDHDRNIPDAYFQTPPIELDGLDSGLEALRFQYLSLLRYGSLMYERYNLSEKRTRLWDDRKDEIVSALNCVAPLRRELSLAGRRLKALGQDDSSIEITLNSTAANASQDGSFDQHISPQQLVKNVAPSTALTVGPTCLALGSAADLQRLTQDFTSFESQKDSDSMNRIMSPESKAEHTQVEHASKRRRLGSRSETQRPIDYPLGDGPLHQGESRDLMPPPVVPTKQSPAHIVNHRGHNYPIEPGGASPRRPNPQLGPPRGSSSFHMQGRGFSASEFDRNRPFTGSERALISASSPGFRARPNLISERQRSFPSDFEGNTRERRPMEEISPAVIIRSQQSQSHFGQKPYPASRQTPTLGMGSHPLKSNVRGHTSWSASNPYNGDTQTGPNVVTDTQYNYNHPTMSELSPIRLGANALSRSQDRVSLPPRNRGMGLSRHARSSGRPSQFPMFTRANCQQDALQTPSRQDPPASPYFRPQHISTVNENSRAAIPLAHGARQTGRIIHVQANRTATAISTTAPNSVHSTQICDTDSHISVNRRRADR